MVSGASNSGEHSEEQAEDPEVRSDVRRIVVRSAVQETV